MDKREIIVGEWSLKISDRICNAGSLTMEATTFSDHALYNMFFSPESTGIKTQERVNQPRVLHPSESSNKSSPEAPEKGRWS